MPIVKWLIPIIGKLADNQPMPIIGRLFVSVSKTTKNAFNCSSH